VSAQRIEQITVALVDLALWVKDGRDPRSSQGRDAPSTTQAANPSASPEMQASHGFSFNPDGAKRMTRKSSMMTAKTTRSLVRCTLMNRNRA